MPLTQLPPLDPSSPSFKADVDTFFRSRIQAFVNEANALAANLNSIAAGGAYAIPYTWGPVASVGTPSGGIIASDGSDTGVAQAATTYLYMTTRQVNGRDISKLLDSMDDSTSLVRGVIRIECVNDDSKFLVYNVVGPHLAGPYHRSVRVACIESSGGNPFATGDLVLVYFQRTGDKGDTGVMGVLPRAKFREQRASGTSAGIAANGANTRDLNTTEFNSIPGASLAASSVTLPAGTYDFQGWAMRYSSGSGLGGHKAYLHNVTDNATVSFGSSGSIGTLSINDRSLVSGRFTIAAAKTFQLRHYIEATSGSGQSLGFASSSGFAEVYSEIEFLKVA